MRFDDLYKDKESLVEGRGIAAREPGTVFTTKDGSKSITLVKVVYFPPDPGYYPTHEALLAAIEEFQESFDGEIFIWNKGNAAMRAMMLTIWKNSEGNFVGHGKFFQKINPGLIGATWPNSVFGRDTGYFSNSAATQTHAVNIKPGDVLSGQKIMIQNAVQEIENGLRSIDADDDLKKQMVSMIKNAIEGRKQPVKGAAKYLKFHEIYSGEFAAPLALVNFSPLVRGDLKAIEENILEPQGLSFSDLRMVQWPSSVNEKLIDSYLMADSFRLGISNKDSAGGAAASVDGIMEIINKKQHQFPEKFITQNQDFIEILKILLSSSSIDGPLKISIRFGIINEADAVEIKERISSFDNNAGTLSRGNQKLLLDAKDYYNPMVSHPNYNIGYHLLAILARRVADRLNNIDISSFFKGVLNYADTIQIYTKVKKSGDDAYFDSFDVVWPPTFDGTIVVNASTNYYATSKPKGRITFKLKK